MAARLPGLSEGAATDTVAREAEKGASRRTCPGCAGSIPVFVVGGIPERRSARPEERSAGQGARAVPRPRSDHMQACVVVLHVIGTGQSPVTWHWHFSVPPTSHSALAQSVLAAHVLA